MARLVVEQDSLTIRTDHQVIGVRDNKRVSFLQHNAHRTAWHRVHQLFDFVPDHSQAFYPSSPQSQGETAKQVRRRPPPRDLPQFNEAGPMDDLADLPSRMAGGLHSG